MCIIAAKPAGVKMPSTETIHNMWVGNPDGAGIMYVKDGRVRIEKGFMTYESFKAKIDELSRTLDMTKTACVMHFRITTHGGTRPENCHPFPVTDSIPALKKLSANVTLGVAHNGIIPITPRKGISDTMEYIATQLAPLHRALPGFTTNKDAMLMIKNAINSKMAFLDRKGRIFTIGDFVEDDGILYSNESYLGYARFRSCSSINSYSGWDWYDDNFDTVPAYTADNCRELMWLDENSIVKFFNGETDEGDGYLLSYDGSIWTYDWESDCALKVTGAWAVRSDSGTTVRFDENSGMLDYIPVDTSTTIDAPLYWK